jgi:hypothetical protein
LLERRARESALADEHFADRFIPFLGDDAVVVEEEFIEGAVGVGGRRGEAELSPAARARRERREDPKDLASEQVNLVYLRALGHGHRSFGASVIREISDTFGREKLLSSARVDEPHIDLLRGKGRDRPHVSRPVYEPYRHGRGQGVDRSCHPYEPGSRRRFRDSQHSRPCPFSRHGRPL